MKLKSYFAGTVEAAMALASRELGDEAMLMYSREATAETKHLGRYEVVFAAPDALPPPPAKEPPVTPAQSDFHVQLAAMQAQIEKLASQVAQRPAEQAQERRIRPRARFETPLSRYQMWIEETLTTSEAPRDLASRVSDEWADAARDVTEDEYLPVLHRTLASMAAANASLGTPDGQCRVVAIVGPPGAGKTSALVKIAARYGMAGKRPTQLISFDNFRIGGADQLRTYAAILGMGFHAVDTAGALRQALEEHRHKELVLIDTPGISAGQEIEGEELSSFLTSRPDIDVHLALSASMKPADLRRVADRFQRFRPDKLLFTRLDETSTFGPIWAEAVVQSKPISFFCNGPGIPEDLQEATAERTAGLALGQAWTEWEQRYAIPPVQHPPGNAAAAA